MIRSEFTLEQAVSLYNENKSLHQTAKLLHTSHIRLSSFFKENGVNIGNIGKEYIVLDNDIQSILQLYNSGKKISEISKELHITTKKVSNILRQNGIKTSRWHLHLKKDKTSKVKTTKDKPCKKCPYCDWVTYDIANTSHAYAKHIIGKHNIDINEHLQKYPDDISYFEKILRRRENKVQCKECGKYLSLIDDRHLQKHNMNKLQYIEKYGDDELISESCKSKLHYCIEQMHKNAEWDRFTSNYEKTLHTFLESNNVSFNAHDRNIIHPYELDIVIPSKATAIEFNGNKYHTEWFGGKARQYHLQKTKVCKDNNIKLLHIFEDELYFSKDIVLNKIAHILGIQQELPRIMARKCQIIEVTRHIAEEFLNKYHIQGFDPSTYYYGAYFDNKLIAIMSFLKSKSNENNWELTRFASDYNYICCGVGGKLFKHFIKEHKPNFVKSFADRRWTVDEVNNIYIQLGFEFDGYVPPDYKYYNPKVDKIRRFHKFNFRKKILLKKYQEQLNENMTETEMVKTLGYDRIWDCGLIKYIWKKEMEA